MGVLTPLRPGAPPPPEALPIGRAALRLAGEGVTVVFGHTAGPGLLTGHVARPGGWQPVTEEAVVAAYDRYPSQGDPDGYDRLRSALGAVPVHNPTAIVRLCRDKLATQRHLEAHGLPMPEVEADPECFADRLAEWGAAYLKPRHGSFGRGIRRVIPGDPTPGTGEGAIAGQTDAMILQRAVPPPTGFRGISVRALVQRTDRGWRVETPVARRSRTDWVVNAARGAEVVPADPSMLPALRQLAEGAAAALATGPDGDGLLEIGVDLVIDQAGTPWIVEVNGLPRGRLDALAATDPRWADAHVEACARPLRWLARRYG